MPTAETAMPPPATADAADNTRARLLQAAFDEIHRSGYGGASLDAILKHTGVTKGALYHHFRSKTDLGSAVIEAFVRPWVEDKWRPMVESSQPLATAIAFVDERLANATDDELALGCPFNNLVQEMGRSRPLFGDQLASIFRDWRHGLEDAVHKSQAAGEMRPDVDASAAAMFLMSAIEGTLGMAKATRNRHHWENAMRGMRAYLESLKA